MSTADRGFFASLRWKSNVFQQYSFTLPRGLDTNSYREGAQDWLCSVAIQEPDDKRAYDYVRQWFWDNRIELPVSNRIDRIIKGKGAAMGTPYLTGGKWEIQPLKNNDFFGVKSGGPYLAGIGKFKRYDEIYKR